MLLCFVENIKIKFALVLRINFRAILLYILCVMCETLLCDVFRKLFTISNINLRLKFYMVCVYYDLRTNISEIAMVE